MNPPDHHLETGCERVAAEPATTSRVTVRPAGEAGHAERVVVFHDGSCPLCQREIAFFRARVPADAVVFEDVSSWPTGARRHGLDAAEAMARFHVRGRDGTVHSGARAFAALWRETPGLRTLGRLGGLAPVAAALELAYRAFLLLRPRLQRLAGGIACPPGSGACRPRR